MTQTRQQIEQMIEDQEVHLEYLRSEMGVQYTDRDPERWDEQRGYIPTTIHRTERTHGEETSDGLDYVVLDSEHIAYRLGGDFRNDGEWEIGSQAEFVQAVLDDAENWLDSAELEREMAEQEWPEEWIGEGE